MELEKYPKVSIIIVNWNGVNHLKTCLESINNQTYRNFEIIFVDNNSKDESVSYVQRNFKNCRIIELDDNYGFCKANNIGTQNAKGEYVVLLNNDTEVDKNWLKELVYIAEENEDVKFVASRMMLFNERDLVDNIGVNYTLSGSVEEIGRYMKYVDKDLNSEEILIGCAGAALYKKSFYDEIGWFNENFFYSYEDIDLSLRTYLLGGKGMLALNSVVYHKLSATRGGSVLNTFYSQRNNEYVWYINTPMCLLFLLLPIRTLYTIGSLLYFLKQGQLKVYLKAKKCFLKNLPEIHRQRNDIQSKRIISGFEYLKLLKKESFLGKIKKFVY